MLLSHNHQKDKKKNQNICFTIVINSPSLNGNSSTLAQKTLVRSTNHEQQIKRKTSLKDASN